jgi:hypothetical protein
MKFLVVLFLVVSTHKIRKPVPFVVADVAKVRPPIDYFWDLCNVTDCTYCVPMSISSYISPNDTLNGIPVGNKCVNFC